MPKLVTIPADFEAVVLTAPPRVDHDVVPGIQNAAMNAKLPKQRGHRIVHMQEVESIDSAALAGLLTIFQVAESHAMKLLLCDPPPIVCSYLEVYGAGALVRECVVYQDKRGNYKTDLLPFVPPFVPTKTGRFDIISGGKLRSLEVRKGELVEIPPVELIERPTQVHTRAIRMAVKQTQKAADEVAELAASGYVFMRRHSCGIDALNSEFQRLHKLHAAYRSKGFDFSSLELWVSDFPTGIVSERLGFRDRAHYEQFAKLLEAPEWKDLAPSGEHTDEFFHLYS